jgi:hypothetical protein
MVSGLAGLKRSRLLTFLSVTQAGGRGVLASAGAASVSGAVTVLHAFGLTGPYRSSAYDHVASGSRALLVAGAANEHRPHNAPVRTNTVGTDLQGWVV